MIRDEALYFRPQMMTKVMNEGWASFWDSYMMTTKGFAGDEGIINYAKHHAGVLGGKNNMGNPYKLGVSLFNDIKERWDKGQHGKEWEECDDMEKKASWDTGDNKGMEKIFEVREMYNDYTFINEFFTRDFCEKYEFFEYGLNRDTNMYEIISRDYDKIKQKLLKRHENGGRPVITLENLKYKNGKEILLRHHYNKLPLDSKYVESTLKMLYTVVNTPISIKTVQVETINTTEYVRPRGNYFGMYSAPSSSVTEIKETPIIYRYDGVRFTRVENDREKIMGTPYIVT